MHEHGQTFTKGNFHYTCKNGTAEVIGTILKITSSNADYILSFQPA
jgi:hypothetical protein